MTPDQPSTPSPADAALETLRRELEKRLPIREQAESLVDTTARLIRQVLIKHQAAVLEEMHAQISARDADLATTRAALAVYREYYEARMAFEASRFGEDEEQRVLLADAAIEQFLREHGEGG